MKLRIKTLEEFTQVEDLSLAKLTLDPLKKLCQESGTDWIKIEVPMCPPSANSYLKHNRYGQTYLSKKVGHFRMLMHAQWLRRKKEFSPQGTLFFVILVESTHWVTKKFTHGIRDVDNVPKVVLDAFKKASKIDDSLGWGNTNLKIPSSIERTHLYVFDLGDVVEMKR